MSKAWAITASAIGCSSAAVDGSKSSATSTRSPGFRLSTNSKMPRTSFEIAVVARMGKMIGRSTAIASTR
ncbi:MAG: hypothetical protein IPK72_02440 [Candidatus Eisenbacteria bacterium]|nr:hypothetical protein [Candidatus Eisenbacteria bacterium]